MSVRLSDVSYSYAPDSPAVLRNVSMDVSDGESVAVMGPSGSGKSTLLGVMGLLLTPTSGSVAFNGRTVSGSRSRSMHRAIEVGWVFQSSNVIATRSVRDNVALPLFARSVRRRETERVVEEALGVMGLSGYGSRKGKSVSGGELQRVCIARAIVTGPSLIVADEPTGNLDAANSSRVMTLLVSAARTRNLCLVVATHDPIVASHCTRTVWIDGNQLHVG